MFRRPPPPPQRLPPFRLHYPTHAGNMLSSIPPPYEMAFPPPQPKRRRSRIAYAAVMFATASVVVASGLWGFRQWANAKARERQLTQIRNERIAETHALLANVHDRFPIGLTEERACGAGPIPEGTRVPLLAFSQLREGSVRTPAEALLQPTSFEVTRDTALSAPVVVVLMTNEATLQPGSYDGWMVVFDRNARPLCEAHVVAKSSGGSFVDLKNQLRDAVRAAGTRLSPNLTLEH